MSEQELFISLIYAAMVEQCENTSLKTWQPSEI